MTNEQKKDFFLFLQKFCSDNVGNRMNEWIIEAFLGRSNRILNEIYKSGQDICPNDANNLNGKKL